MQAIHPARMEASEFVYIGCIDLSGGLDYTDTISEFTCINAAVG